MGRILIASVSAVLAAGAFAGAGAPAPGRSVLEGVPELAKRVSYSETKISLADLVRRVGRDTGAALTAAAAVADEPTAVAVRELPARELLQQLAELLDYQWRRAGRESSPRWELGQDLASRKREEALRQALAGEVDRRFHEALRSTIKMAALAPEQLEELAAQGDRRARELATRPQAEQQAFRYSPEGREFFARSGRARQLWSRLNRALVKFVAGLTAAEWDLIRKGDPVTFSSAPQPGDLLLPRELQRTLREAGFRLTRPREMPLPPARAGDEEAAERRARQSQEQWSGASGHQVVVWLDAERAPEELGLLVNAYPMDDRGPVPGFWGGENAFVQISAGSWAVKLQQRSEERSAETEAALERDPVLGARRPFLPDPAAGLAAWGRQLPDYLPAVARAFDVPILSDSYWRSVLVSPVTSPEPVALHSLLDRLAGTHHRWEHSDGLLRLRHRTWYVERPREIPLRVVRHWQETCKEHGALRWEELLAARTALTDLQRTSLGETVLERFGLPVDFGANGSRFAPLLYHTLAPAQGQRLRQGLPLSAAGLTAAQRRLFLEPLRSVQRYNLRSRLPPATVRDWTAASFSLQRELLLRRREERNGVVKYRTQPAASDTPIPAGAPDGTRSYLVTRWRFRYHYSPEARVTEELTVAGGP